MSIRLIVEGCASVEEALDADVDGTELANCLSGAHDPAVTHLFTESSDEFVVDLDKLNPAVRALRFRMSV